MVADFPDYSSRTKDLYGLGMYQEIYRVLKPMGIASVYSNLGHDTVRASMARGFFGYRYYPISIPYMGQTVIFNAIKR